MMKIVKMIFSWSRYWLSKRINFHKDLPFLPERKKVEKVEKRICSIEDKEKYVIHIRALKQALNHGLKLGIENNLV